MSNLTILTVRIIRKFKKTVVGWEKDREKLKEQYEAETNSKEMAKLANSIWTITNEIVEAEDLIKDIEDDAKTKQQ